MTAAGEDEVIPTEGHRFTAQQLPTRQLWGAVIVPMKLPDTPADDPDEFLDLPMLEETLLSKRGLWIDWDCGDSMERNLSDRGLLGAGSESSPQQGSGDEAHVNSSRRLCAKSSLHPASSPNRLGR